jgi:hypothetical protein
MSIYVQVCVCVYVNLYVKACVLLIHVYRMCHHIVARLQEHILGITWRKNPVNMLWFIFVFEFSTTVV